MALTTLKSSLHASASWHAVRSQRGTIYLQNGADRPQAWDGIATTTRNWGISAPTVKIVTSANAAGALTGTYQYYKSFVNKNATDGNLYSNQNPVSTAITVTTKKISATRGSASSDSQVTHWRLFRNTNGQTTTFYKVADVSASVTSYVDNNSDTTISANEVMETDHVLPDAKKPYAMHMHGRIVRWGSRVEKTGTVSATKGSTSISGTGTYFKDAHDGMYFKVVGDAEEYEIGSITSTTKLTLARNYSGTTGGGKSFAIYPVTARHEVEWSKTGQPEYFPTANRTNVFPDDGDEPTGCFVVGYAGVLAKRNHLYRMIFQSDPNPTTGDGAILRALSSRGLLNQRCVAVVDHAAYLMDQRGMYEYDGRSNYTPIDVQIAPTVQPSAEAAADRINWAQKEKFHCVYDPQRDRVCFFVAMGTDTEPKNALCYERQLQRWTLEEYRMGITASCLMPDSSGRLRAWVADDNGLIWALGVNQKGIDGAAPEANGTIRGTATSGASTTLTDTAATFYTTGDGLAGVPVYIYEGTGSAQWNIIKSNTGTVLTVETAWTTNPDSTSKYYIGAIEWSAKTRWFALDQPGMKKRYAKLRLHFAPHASDQWLGVKVYYDLSSTVFSGWQRQRGRTRGDGLEIPASALTDGQVRLHLDETDGHVVMPLEEHKRWVRFEFQQINTGYKPVVLGYEYLGEVIYGTDKHGG